MCLALDSGSLVFRR